MDVLIHISQQLSNSTTPAFEPTAFQVPSNAAAVNMLFFLSLALVLIDAFLAMLVKGWLQEFDRGWRKCTVAHLRAQEREWRLQELERWKLDELVALLPILIQGSLLLFCIGLLVLIFPLHRPSGILCSLLFMAVVGFYGLTTYVSIVNKHAPFSSPVSRLLARGFTMLRSWYILIIHNTQRIASAISFHSNHPPPPQGQQAGADPSDETTQPLTSYNGVAERAQFHNPDSDKKSKMVLRSLSGIDPRTRIDVLERLITTIDEAVESLPIFLELLDRPVKDPTLRPLNMEQWKKLFHITLGLLGDQSISDSAACTLARTMMICYNREAPDRRLYLTLDYHLGSRYTGDSRRRMPLNGLFSSYLPYWLGYSSSNGLSHRIAFLEPNDAVDAELLWMVNTFHQSMQYGEKAFKDPLENYFEIFAGVLTYVSSTEQSRRSKVPLTAAVIYALHTIRLAIDQGGINLIGDLYILPGNVSTSEPVLMTFCHVDGIDALDLWSEDCIQFVKELLQWDWASYLLNDFRFSLIAALYIDSTKHAHTRTTFEDLLKHTRIADIKFEFSDAYDDDDRAMYSYMALTQKPLPLDFHSLALPWFLIHQAISEYSTLQVSGLQILEMALNHFRYRELSPLNRLIMSGCDLIITTCDDGTGLVIPISDRWILLHLDTLMLPPQPYLPSEDVKMLEWSDTPAKVHIACARLDLYTASVHTASVYTEAGSSLGPVRVEATKPNPELLRMFLWSKDHGVCMRAFSWCLYLVPISQSDRPGDANSTRMFIPETMGYEWVAQFIHVLCKGEYRERAASWALSQIGPCCRLLGAMTLLQHYCSPLCSP